MKFLLGLSLMFAVSCSADQLADLAQGFIDEYSFDATAYLDEVGYEEDYEGDEERKLPISDEAYAVMEAVRDYAEDVREQRKEICARDESIKDQIEEALEEIRDSEGLSREEMHENAMAVLDSFKEELEADKEVYETCLEDNAEEIAVFDAEIEGLHEACFVEGFNQKRKRKPLGKRGRGPREKLSDEVISELENQLLSEECISYISYVAEDEESVDNEESDSEESI